MINLLPFSRYSFLAAWLLFFSCETKKKELPILGRPTITTQVIENQTVIDTISHKIADFSLLNQDSLQITNSSLAGKIYVADFFFTSCPTICPVMKKQLLRVYERYLEDDRIMIVSHSIDPTYDNVNVLSDYSDALGVISDKWHFLTGDQDEIYQLGEKSYMVTAGADEDAPGGYIHSGAFLLVDTNRQIRGVYDGTMKEQVDQLIIDIDILLDEEFGKK
ncbi:protein SCO1/2 [Reichenbachiella agariperforans]|uniref:Protein SCO1/2 n=1 Tax=Reichenbachiella agariperforans TaxID=156994 RepID=A0A1M6LAK4_REIAG|nr:SCO family protein [Reichenbachiella agariperforans]SHJ68193.1 protein SCO1/2 [Reichenbachiella agariperforans]